MLTPQEVVGGIVGAFVGGVGGAFIVAVALWLRRCREKSRWVRVPFARLPLGAHFQYVGHPNWWFAKIDDRGTIARWDDAFALGWEKRQDLCSFGDDLNAEVEVRVPPC